MAAGSGKIDSGLTATSENLDDSKDPKDIVLTDCPKKINKTW